MKSSVLVPAVIPAAQLVYAVVADVDLSAQVTGYGAVVDADPSIQAVVVEGDAAANTLKTTNKNNYDDKKIF